MKDRIEYTNCMGLAKRYRNLESSATQLKRKYNSLINKLHETELLISWYNNMPCGFSIKKLKKIAKGNLYYYSQDISPKDKLIIKKYTELIRRRKDLNILISHYKKEWQRTLVSFNRYLMAYNFIYQNARSIKNDSDFIRNYPIAIYHINNSKFAVWYDKHDDGRFYEVL